MTIFLGATLLFISLFNQTIQTAIVYQRHRNLATKCSDLLDNMLLNPGTPLDWGMSNSTPIGFGLQDPEFTQYKLSPFSLMRLQSWSGDPVFYEKTGLYYSNITMGFGNFLLVPYAEAINYSTATRLLGINGSYGFQLTVTPIVSVSVSEVQPESPLRIAVSVSGTGFPLSNAAISYCLLTVALAGGGAYPSYSLEYGSAYADNTGYALLEFDEVDDDEICYAFIAYAHLSGLVGVGYHERVTSSQQYIIPFIEDFATRRVLIAHSYDVHYLEPPEAELSYNATFVLLTEDFTLRELSLGANTTGKVNYGEGRPYRNVTIPTYNPGILIITYRKSAMEGGVVMMPWGINSLAFPVAFGDDPFNREWVATDLRQVVINEVAYQVKLALWSLEGYQVIG